MRVPNQSIGIRRQPSATVVHSQIVPSRFSWRNVGFPELEWGYWRNFADLTGGRPSPGACDLACGEERADCFREGGSRRKCDQGQQECLMNCFFNYGEN